MKRFVLMFAALGLLFASTPEENGAGDNNGNDGTVQAVTVEPNHVSAISAVLAGKANLGSSVASDLKVGFQYSKSAGILPSNSTTVEATDADANYNYTSSITGLEPATTYYFRSFVRRLVGPDNTVYGSFSTGCDIPEAISSSKDKTQLRPANAQSVPVADPFILYEDGIYYLYGTGAANGIAVYVSEDMQSWASAPSLALNKEDSYGNRWFWAPEVYHVGDKYYMYYSAEEHICVATSNSPTGPFVQSDKSPIVPYKAIDNTLFFDKEGNPWLFFVKFNDGIQIWSARLEEDLIHIIPGSEQKCLEMSQEWEKVWPSVNEGPFLLYHNGLYYLTYSANSFESPYYGIGYATAPSPEGPWTKFENNPVYQCVGSLEGVGHHSFFKDKSGKDRIVFHSHNAPGKIGPRIIHISDYNFKKDGTLVISPAYFTPWVE